nr:MAG TPA: hypothetical protein [Caudoviricetes sp.]
MKSIFFCVNSIRVKMDKVSLRTSVEKLPKD